MNDLMTKSFMSYVDLKKEALKDLEAEEASALEEIEMSTIAADDNLRRFFEDAGLVKDDMAAIRSLLSQLHHSHDQSKSATDPHSLRSLRHRLNSDVLKILHTARSIRDRLESMDRANAQSRRLSGFKHGTPIDRTRTSVTNGLRKKLKDLMMDFQNLRQKIMAEYKETVERRYFTVTGEVPDEEVIEKIISNGESEELVRKSITANVVHEIQDRHDAAKEIERSLLELHQVFLDMAVMVEAQGEKMDDIEHHVTSAAHYVKDGTKELRTAKEYQRGSRKCLCIAIVLLLILILVIVVPVVATLHQS